MKKVYVDCKREIKRIFDKMIREEKMEFLLEDKKFCINSV